VIAMTEGMRKREAFCLRAVALIAINILAAIYDSQWLYAAIAADFAVLGYSLTQIEKTREVLVTKKRGGK
jgi:hypothetical protein